MMSWSILTFILTFFSCCVARLSVPELITKNGYPVEVHHVTTSDGYILTLHRIPHSKTSKDTSTKPVLLQHGLFCSSDSFLLFEDALGFFLAKEGYDVWLGNARGNDQSRNHTSLDPDQDPEFWDFSWHEIGTIDLPTMIDYILKITNQQSLSYIGHSQGTTTFYVMATMRPEYNSKIRVQVSLAPVAYLKHVPKLVLRIGVPLVDSVKTLLSGFGINEFLPNDGIFSKIEVFVCRISDLTCKLFYMVVFEFSPSKIKRTPLTLLTGYFPAGSSTKQVAHFGQVVKSGFFRRYDFGKRKNTEMYGSNEPPSYNLTLITARCYLFYGHRDEVVAEENVIRLCKDISNCAGNFPVADEKFNHMDHLVGVDAPTVLYPRVVDVLSKY